MQTIRKHSHTDRERVIQTLIPELRNVFKDNMVGLAAEGSYARNEDQDYSDLELTVFLKKLPQNYWEIRKIENGLLIVVTAETKESYITKYLDVSDVWYASGATKLLPIINDQLIEELNSYTPVDVERKAFAQIRKRWFHFQEITSKLLNTLKQQNTDARSLVFHEMMKELLVILSFLNTTPYVTLGSYITQAKEFKIQPTGFRALIDIAINGNYQDLKISTIEDMFTDLETLVLPPIVQ